MISSASHFTLIHRHRVTVTGWKSIHPTTNQTNRSKGNLDLFTRFLQVWVSQSCIRLKPVSSHFVLLGWANVTPVKILYKAYPSSHNTAKCKKGPARHVTRDLLSPYHLVLFSIKVNAQLKKPNIAPLCIKCKLQKVKWQIFIRFIC